MAHYLAVFTGGPDSPAMARWAQLTDAEKAERQQQGIKAWNDWVDVHAAAIVTLGGPLGPVTEISDAGVRSSHNRLSGFSVISADSPEEAAALFENHPHFSLFPGDGVEIMPILPVPGRG